MLNDVNLPHRARQLGNSDALRVAARAGFAVSGLLHLLIGWIAVRVAIGGSGDSADQSGALAEVASAPGGRVLLWIAVVALAALALWQLVEATLGASRVASSDRTTARAKAAAKAVVYAALAVTALSFARGSGTSTSAQSSDMTASLLQSTPGRVLVALAGAVVLGVGAYHVWKGWTRKFLDDLRSTGQGQLGRAVVWLGRIGYVAKGIALGVVGALFGVAAATVDPSKATGLDGALRTLREQPAGSVLLVAVAAGFVAFGLYSFARARYAKM